MTRKEAVARMNRYISKLATALARGDRPLHEKQAGVHKLTQFSHELEKSGNIVKAVTATWPEMPYPKVVKVAQRLVRGASKHANAMMGYGPGAAPGAAGAVPGAMAGAAPMATGNDGAPANPGGAVAQVAGTAPTALPGGAGGAGGAAAAMKTADGWNDAAQTMESVMNYTSQHPASVLGGIGGGALGYLSADRDRDESPALRGLLGAGLGGVGGYAADRLQQAHAENQSPMRHLQNLFNDESGAERLIDSGADKAKGLWNAYGAPALESLSQ